MARFRNALLCIILLTPVLQAGNEIYQSSYPRITREWTDATGILHFGIGVEYQEHQTQHNAIFKSG